MSSRPSPDLGASYRDRTLSAPAEPVVVHRALAQIRPSNEPLLATLGRLLVVAQHLLPHRPGVSITLVQGGRAETLASSDDLAWRLDQRQYAEAAGPCLTAATTGGEVTVVTASPPQEYRPFAEAAAAAGVVEVLSLSLAAATGTASLNIYNTTSHPFEQQSRAAAHNIVGYLSAFLVNLAFHQHPALPGEQPEVPRLPRGIDRAEGVLLAGYAYSPDVAFDRLVDLSQRGDAQPRP